VAGPGLQSPGVQGESFACEQKKISGPAGDVVQAATGSAVCAGAGSDWRAGLVMGILEKVLSSSRS
jgi:hypothetical protein